MAAAHAWLRFASLQLGRQLGTEVVPVISRKETADPTVRAQILAQSLCTAGQLIGAIRIPDTGGHLVVTADLRAGRVTCHVDVEAPREGRPTTRVNWLVRQLKNAPDGCRVEAFVAHARGSQAAELLSTVRESPASLVLDSAKEIRTFRIAVTTSLGTTRGRGRGSFIDSVLSAVDGFYSEVLGSLRAWSAAPPKLRPVHAEPREVDATVPAALQSTDYSSQDGSHNGDSSSREADSSGSHSDDADTPIAAPSHAPGDGSASADSDEHGPGSSPGE